MAHNMDFGYIEGDDLGKAYDLKVLKRLGQFSLPHLRLIILACLMTVFTIGLDLALPYLTRQAIDLYIVRRAMPVDSRALSPAQARALQRETTGSLYKAADGRWFIAEQAWRRVTPSLGKAIRAKGAAAGEPWNQAPAGPEAERLAARHPELFVRAEGKLFLPPDGYRRLGPETSAGLRAPDVRGLIWLGALFAALSLASFVLTYGQQVTLEKAGQRMMHDIRQALWSHLLARPLAFFGRHPVGKLVTRLTNDVVNLNEMYRSTLMSVFQDLFLFVGIVAILLWLDYKLALLCLCLVPLILAAAWGFSRLARDAFRHLSGWLGRMNARLGEAVDGMMVVKLFRAEARAEAEFDQLNQSHYRAGMRQVKVFTVFMPLIDFLSSLAVALIIWYGGGKVVQETTSLGTLVAFISYMQMFFRPVRDIAEKYNILQAAMASGERILTLLDDRETLSDLPSPGGPPLGQSVGLAFERVSFGYQPGQEVLKQVSFNIPAGETWAVVGPTGSGKTSLVNLLLRFYDPDQGRVLLNGRDLRGFGRDELAPAMALVDQEVYLFSGTVEENLLAGRDLGPEALDRALAVSGAREVVDRLPQGLATPLGEGAGNLSSGERQLLSLARALAGDPPLLVLDEATSSVDPESEALIQEALPRAMAGRTSLVVAHRLSTIRKADNILVMKAGRIVESGSHAELLKTGGLYSHLVELQELAARNREEAAGNAVP